jgi:HK97 family phage major capsid protein
MTWQQRKKLAEERAQILADMKAILDKSETEKRDLTPEENTSFDDFNTRAEALKTKIERCDTLLAAYADQGEGDENRSQRPGHHDVDNQPGGEERSEGDQLEERHAEAFDAYLRGGLEGMSPEQRSVLSTGRMQVDGETRAVSVGGTGVIGSRGFQAKLIKSLRNYTGVLEAGARVLTTATGNSIGMLTVDDTANEGSDEKAHGSDADDDVDPPFVSKELGAYTYDSGVVLVPYELLQDSEVDLAAEILDLASERIGVKLNGRTTTGNGTTQPQGFVTGAGVGKTAASQTAITYDELIDFQHSLNAAYRRRGGAFQFNDTTLAALRKLKDGDGRYIFMAGVAGEPDRFMNKPYVVNDAMADIAAAAKPIAFGDFSRYRVRLVANPFIRRLEERYAEKRSVGFYIAQRADGRLADAKAVKVLQMAAAE